MKKYRQLLVPAGCAVNGDELRSTTVLANSPIAEYQRRLSVCPRLYRSLISIIFSVAQE